MQSALHNRGLCIPSFTLRHGERSRLERRSGTPSRARRCAMPRGERLFSDPAGVAQSAVSLLTVDLAPALHTPMFVFAGESCACAPRPLSCISFRFSSVFHVFLLLLSLLVLPVFPCSPRMGS